MKLVELPGEDGKITAETLKSFLADRFGHSQHQMIASALSITQATEAGTVYRPNEIAALSEVAMKRFYRPKDIPTSGWVDERARIDYEDKR